MWFYVKIYDNVKLIATNVDASIANVKRLYLWLITDPSLLHV
jgi:hypothetical protein